MEKYYLEQYKRVNMGNVTTSSKSRQNLEEITRQSVRIPCCQPEVWQNIIRNIDGFFSYISAVAVILKCIQDITVKTALKFKKMPQSTIAIYSVLKCECNTRSWEGWERVLSVAVNFNAYSSLKLQ